MPIYEYSCLKCEHKFEKLVFGQSAEVTCPECQSSQTKKLFSAFGFKSSGSFSSSSGQDSCHSCGSHHCSSCGSH